VKASRKAGADESLGDRAKRSAAAAAITSGLLASAADECLRYRCNGEEKQ
jgi:hypothetical protein